MLTIDNNILIKPAMWHIPCLKGVLCVCMYPLFHLPCLDSPRECCVADFDWPTGSVGLFGCLPNTNPQQLTTRHSGEVPYWQGWLFLPFCAKTLDMIQMCVQQVYTHTDQQQHKLQVDTRGHKPRSRNSVFVCLNMHYTAHAWQESKCSFKSS